MKLTIMPLAITSLLALAACPASNPPGASCPASSLPAAPACPIAGLPHNGLHHNSLSFESLDDNQALLDFLKQHQLGPGLFTGHADLLTPTHAAELMDYIASCALDPCASVDVPAPAAGEDPALAYVRAARPDGFRGEMGLCDDTYNTNRPPNAAVEPPWTSTMVPTNACLERVSACVLSRANQLGKRVLISIRGDGVALVDQVPVEATYRENHGTPIASFSACTSECLWADPVRRNCDWEPRHVGQCVRGSLADEQAGAGTPNMVALTAPTTGVRIRVCPGIHGCDDPTASPVPPAPEYSGAPLAQGLNQVAFACPDNGPVITDAGGAYRTGYYSAMVAAEEGAALPLGLDLALTTASGPSDHYPAAERAVFTYREGAFYGQLFSTVPLRSPPCGEGVMFPAQQYVCFSALWNQGAAMASDRFCAGPASSCFVTETAGCDPDAIQPPWVPMPVQLPGVGVPDPLSPPDAVVYDQCVGPGGVPPWEHPYTTYLNHPCDLFPSLNACRKYLSAAVVAALPPLPHRGR